MSEKTKDKKVMPVDNVTVYSTDKLKSLYPVVGTPIECHTAVAEKLLNDGKATKEAPGSAKKGKGDKGGEGDES